MSLSFSESILFHFIKLFKMSIFAHRTGAKFPIKLEKGCTYAEKCAFSLEFEIIRNHLNNNVKETAMVKPC